MDPELIAGWMHGLDEFAVVDEASVSVAREAVRSIGSSLGMSRDAVERGAVIASELGHNQLAHARHGRMAVVAADARQGVAGIEIVAADHGVGISSPRAAFEGTPRATGSLGVGLAGVRRLTTELDVDVRIGEGTCIRARIWDGVVARRREVGILGRPCPGELLSGDHAWFRREPRGLLVCVVDGLGHGLPAREASDAALDAFRKHVSSSLPGILERIDEATATTRGVALTLLSFDGAEQSLEVGGIGNVSARIDSLQRRCAFATTAGVLGGRRGTRKAHFERVDVDASDVVVAFSDGLATRTSLQDAGVSMHEQPIVIAEQLLSFFGRTTDDAIVAVIR